MRRLGLVAFTLVAAWALIHTPYARAQSKPLPPPPKPYGAVALTLPRPLADASFEAFRKELAAIVKRRSQADLLNLVVEKGFFWERDFGGSFEADKSAADNFTRAFHFGREIGDTWERLAAIAAERAVSRHETRRGLVCAPGEPIYNRAALDRLYDATNTDGLDWAYPRAASTPVRIVPQPNAALMDTLKLHFVRTLGHSGPENDPDPLANHWAQVVMPSGKTGYVPPASLTTLLVERLCFGKDARGRWRTAGYVGGGD
jgi:hypothetical protein